MAISQIGTIDKRESRDRATEYVRKLYVPAGDIASIPQIDDSASSWTGVSNTWVKEVNKEGQVPGTNGTWLVTVTAGPYEVDAGTSMPSKLEDRTEAKYSSSELFFPMDWWGVRKATESDKEKKYLNVDQEFCSPGDYLYRNADVVTGGQANYEKSPFVISTGIPLEMIERKISLDVFTITYHKRAKLAAVTNVLVGVNGAASFPDKVKRDIWDTVTGVWRIASSRKIPVRDGDGKAYCRLQIRLEHAPILAEGLKLKWDPDKNGGTFTLPTI